MRYLRFLIELLKINQGKIIIIGFVFLLIIPFNYCDDFTVECVVETSFISTNKKFCYVIGKGDSYSVVAFDKKPKENGKMISYQQTNPFRILSLVVIVILLLTLILITIIGWNETPGWNLNRCLVESCLSEVNCEFEDDKYFLHFEGRLIYKSDYQPQEGEIYERLERYFRSNKSIYPKFLSKLQRRDKKLTELLS
jgi:hypothetical protein